MRLLARQCPDPSDKPEVESRGVEPRFLVCQPSVLPLDDDPLWSLVRPHLFTRRCRVPESPYTLELDLQPWRAREPAAGREGIEPSPLGLEPRWSP